MRQHGRKSANELTVIPFASAPQHVQAPADLSAIEAKAFDELVSSCPPNHFVQSDASIIANYVRVAVLVTNCARKLKGCHRLADAEILQSLVKTQMALAARLRLGPLGRIGPRTAGRRSANHNPPSVYDLMGQRNE